MFGVQIESKRDFFLYITITWYGCDMRLVLCFFYIINLSMSYETLRSVIVRDQIRRRNPLHCYLNERLPRFHPALNLIHYLSAKCILFSLNI